MTQRFEARKRLIFTLLATVVVFCTLVGTSQALWHNLLYETFERDSGTWPWNRSGNQWLLRPWPPSHPNYTWGVEDSAVYRPGPTGYYRAAFCSGLPNGLIPGIDEYLGNQNAWMRWGPFDLDEAVIASGGFWVYADTEVMPGGDPLYVLTTNNQQNRFGRTDITRWVQVDTVSGTTHGQWLNFSFDFADLDTANATRDSVSYLGREDVYIAFCFQSDTDGNRGLGIFIDDISFGYDDGEFDMEMNTLAFYDANDTTHQVENCEVNDPIQIIHSFWNRGPEQPATARNVLFINDEPVDTVEGIWESDPFGVMHRLWFEYIWVPHEVGDYELRCELDYEDAIDENDENNNSYSYTFTVTEEQLPPWIEWISPTEAGLSHTDSVEIVYIAHNSPSDEEALITFFWDDDNEGFNGTVITESREMPVTNQEETFIWDITSLPFDEEIYIYAHMTDGYHGPQRSYAPGPIIHQVGVDETPDGAIPDRFEILSVYPNPFNPTVEINFNLPSPNTVRANWYTVNGRQVDQQVYHQMSAGTHSITWTPGALASGLYFLRLHTPEATMMTKVIYVK